MTVVLIMGVAALAFGATAAPAPPHVTVIGDSVLTAVEWNEAPLALLQKGLDAYMDIGVCRTVTGVSCPYEGGRVPTLMDVIAGMGVRLGPTVLVEVGSNDDPSTIGRDVDAAVGWAGAAPPPPGRGPRPPPPPPCRRCCASASSGSSG